MPGWQKVYSELKDKNFEIISVAEDTGGLKIAGPIFKRSKATFTQVVDPFHTISSLFEMVNVPSGVWIDEKGMIVRPPEVAYVGKMKLGPVAVDGEAYVNALRDWVEKGAKSEYILSQKTIQERLANKSAADHFSDEADANFKLAAYFHSEGKKDQAERYFERAQELNPESWNYHRQNWSFLPTFKDTMKKFNAKVKETTETGKLYYAPNDLSNPNAEKNLAKENANQQ